MEIRQLQYFIEIAECKSYSIASKRLFVSQPALSLSIKKLEEEFNIKLFMNNQRERIVELTIEGEKFYKIAKEYIGSHNLLLSAFHEIKDNISGTISIALPYVITHELLLEPLTQFKMKYKDVVLDIVTMDGRSIQHAVSTGRCEIGVTLLPFLKDNFVYKCFKPYPFKIGVKKNSPLASREIVSFNDLKNEKWISYSKDSTLYQLLIEQTQRCGYMPDITMYSSELDFIAKYSRADDCIFLTADLGALTAYKNDFNFLPIEADNFEYQLVLFKANNHFISRPAEILFNFISDWIDNDMR